MIYPKFDRGKILRGDMLNALRDNPVSAVQLFYQRHGDGIINGFDVATDGNNISVTPGILKSDGEILFSTEILNIELTNGKNFVYLNRLRAENEVGLSIKFELEARDRIVDGAFELFRCGKNGVLKNYSSFDDLLNAQHNRIDRRHAAFAINGGTSLDPNIFALYAQAVFERESTVEDKIFAYMCLNESLTRRAIDQYFGASGLSNVELIDAMKRKLEDMHSSGLTFKPSVNHKKIIDQIEVF